MGASSGQQRLARPRAGRRRRRGRAPVAVGAEHLVEHEQRDVDARRSRPASRVTTAAVVTASAGTVASGGDVGSVAQVLVERRVGSVARASRHRVRRAVTAVMQRTAECGAVDDGSPSRSTIDAEAPAPGRWSGKSRADGGSRGSRCALRRRGDQRAGGARSARRPRGRRGVARRARSHRPSTSTAGQPVARRGRPRRRAVIAPAAARGPVAAGTGQRARSA